MRISSSQKVFAVIITLLLIQGCATKSVADSNRDRSGAYDGQWQAKILKGPSTQYIQNWVVNCNRPAFDMDMSVSQGQVVVSAVGSEDSITTNIDSSGKFAFVIPLADKAQASGNSATVLTNGNRRLFLKGNLSESKQKGSFTMGIQQFGWQGCTSKVRFKRMPESSGTGV